MEERHTILKGFLECVYVDLAEPTTLVGIKPKPQFLEFLGQAGSESRAPDKGENRLRCYFSIGACFDGIVETGESQPLQQLKNIRARVKDSKGVVWILRFV